jgi:hypothetical protein
MRMENEECGKKYKCCNKFEFKVGKIWHIFEDNKI